MAQERTAGTVEAGAFYGYQPMVLVLGATGGFLADTVDGNTSVITEGGFTKTTQVVETFGSIVWMGEQDDDSFACVVDGPSFNKGEAGDFAELVTAVTAVRDGSANVTVTTSAALNGDGTFTLA
jgi:hypothetical protein